VWRRTVLVADPSLLSYLGSLARTDLPAHIYMKAKTTKSHETEPVGIVISRGLRTEPAPLILAFEWGLAPDLSPTSQDHKAA
jgi:hypothetical protein